MVGPSSKPLFPQVWPPTLTPHGEVSRTAPRVRSWADSTESGSCQEAGSGGQWDRLLGGGESRQGLWAQGEPPPSPAQAMWFHLALACCTGGASRMAWIRVWLGQTSSFLC